MSETLPDSPARRALFRAAFASGLIAAVFCAAVAFVMVQSERHAQALSPIETPQVRVLKKALDADPSNVEIKHKIRQLDLEVRRDFWQSRQRIESGRYLLLFGVIAMLLCLGVALMARRQPPMPEKLDLDELSRRQRPSLGGRWSLAAFAVALAAVALILGFQSQQAARWQAAIAAPPQKPSSAAPAAAYPTPEQIAANWPMFRGPGGLATSAAKDVPQNWNAKSGEGLLWKAKVPLPGMSSPIIWGDRVIVTGGSKAKHEVYCFNLADGKLAWSQSIPVTKPPEDASEPSEDTGFAPSTPATDGQRIFAIFVNGDLACLDMDGKIAWTKNLGVPNNTYGHASSLVVWRDKLFVQFDQGTVEDDRSALLAFDAATGKPAWRAKRKVDSSWSTPVLATIGGKVQLVTVAKPLVIAYDPDDGKELWSVQWIAPSATVEVAPSAALAGGKVVVANAQANATALAVSAAGGKFTAKPAWTGDQGLPDIVSPVAAEKFALLVDSGGTLTCYDAASGAVAWTHDVESPISSSPVLAAGRVYLLDREGICHVFEALPEFKELARCELGEPCFATPAIVQGRIVIRGAGHLYCIGKRP